MRIGFIGAGKVGTAFGAYLSSKGLCISGFYSRTPESARNAAKLSNSSFFSDVRKLSDNTDILFITTSDDSIETVCDQLTKDCILRQGQIIVHMSGALPSSVLKSSRQAGCYVCSMHPLQAFADINKAVEDLPDTYFSIEGDEEKIHILEDILKAAGNRYFVIKPQDKTIYHAAACVFSNYLTTLMNEGLGMLSSIGIDSAEGFEAVLPLIKGTISNIAALGPDKALTGPIARGDASTVQKHLTAINTAIPDMLELYSYLAEKTFELAKSFKLTDSEKIKNLEHILNGGGF